MEDNPMVKAPYSMNDAMRSTPASYTPKIPGLNTGSTPGDRQAIPNAPGFTIHPPGVATGAQEYNYEPQTDGSWKTYPPGVQAPLIGWQTSMPRAATNSDMMRMQQEMAQLMGESRTGL
jgi:hypothetical protein